MNQANRKSFRVLVLSSLWVSLGLFGGCRPEVNKLTEGNTGGGGGDLSPSAGGNDGGDPSTPTGGTHKGGSTNKVGFSGRGGTSSVGGSSVPTGGNSNSPGGSGGTNATAPHGGTGGTGKGGTSASSTTVKQLDLNGFVELFGTATADSQENYGGARVHLATHGNDGNYTTRWTASDGNMNHYWTIDLGCAQSPSKVVVYWEYPFNNYSESYGYIIKTSNDGVTYETVVEKSDTGVVQWADLPAGTTARMIRIVTTSVPVGGDWPAWIGFWELRVFAASKIDCGSGGSGGTSGIGSGGTSAIGGSGSGGTSVIGGSGSGGTSVIGGSGSGGTSVIGDGGDGGAGG